MLKTIAALGAAFLLAACAGTPADKVLTKNTGLTVQQRCAGAVVGLSFAKSMYEAIRTNEKRSAKEIETYRVAVISAQSLLDACMAQPPMPGQPTMTVEPTPSKPE